ncbi:MAG: hypothetical protein KGI50_06035 [Patescibacteria group bacterium]|nr:hypothetical protein [Patescibacteria group bacterium]
MTEKNIPVPSVGRDVIFHHPSTREADTKMVESPGKVLKVYADGNVDLIVFMAFGGVKNYTNIEYGVGLRQWSWPKGV